MGATLLLRAGDGAQLFGHRQSPNDFEPDYLKLAASLGITLPRNFDVYGNIVPVPPIESAIYLPADDHDTTDHPTPSCMAAVTLPAMIDQSNAHVVEA